MEKVKEEDLLPPKGGAAGGAERRLPQPRPKRPAPKPRKRKSPLFAVVILVVLATACFLGYSAVYNPAAFTFLNPEKVKAIMESKKIKDLYPLSNVDGYYLERQGSDRMFVIKGVVTNRSDKAQSLMSIEGSLFSATGGEMASLVVFCGNNFTRHELEALPTATIDKRQQNRVGDALSNVDIAPGSGVTFMVVFTSPPDGVEKYSVTVLGPDSSGGD